MLSNKVSAKLTDSVHVRMCTCDFAGHAFDINVNLGNFTSSASSSSVLLSHNMVSATLWSNMGLHICWRESSLSFFFILLCHYDVVLIEPMRQHSFLDVSERRLQAAAGRFNLTVSHCNTSVHQLQPSAFLLSVQELGVNYGRGSAPHAGLATPLTSVTSVPTRIVRTHTQRVVGNCITSW